MANLQGYGTAAVGNMLNHYTRHGHDRDQTKYTYANQTIDPARTRLNYAIFEREDPGAFVRSMVDGADVKPKGGEKATNVLSDWVVTLPKNPALEGREREFFRVAYDFLRQTVPEDLVVGAWVHMDENQPHMHFAFCPRVRTAVMTNDKSRPLRDSKGQLKRDRKGTVRYARVQKVGEDGKPIFRTSFGQSKVFDRRAMKQFHPQLEKAMERHFGFEVGIMLTEEQQTEKALSNVDQKDIDRAREGIEGPARAEAARIVADAQARADEMLSAAELRKAELVAAIADKEGDLAELDNYLDDVSREVERESDRLECLRQAREGVGERVERLESIAADVRSFEGARGARRAEILDRLARKVGELRSALDRGFDALSGLLRRFEFGPCPNPPIAVQAAAAGRSAPQAGCYDLAVESSDMRGARGALGAVESVEWLPGRAVGGEQGGDER